MTATALGALLIILLAWLARRAGVIPAEAGPHLVRVVLYVTLPALVFRIMVTADLQASLLLVPLVGLAVHGVLVGAALVSARMGRLDRPTTGALIVASAVGNTGFFGIPLIAASGPGLSLPAAVMFDTFCTGVLTWTSTMWVAARFGEPDGAAMPAGPDRALWRNLLLPPTWGVLAGLALNLAGAGELPDVLDRPLAILGGAVLPLVLIYAGLVIEWDAIRRAWRQVAWASVLRFLVSPLAALALAVAIGLDGDVLRTVVLMAAMPTAMMSLVIGGWYRLKTEVIAGAVVATVLLAPIVLPAVRALL